MLRKALAQTQTPLLHTTLDDITSVSNPVYGTGAGSSVNTTPTNDFVLGHSGNGIRVDGGSEYVRFQESDGSTQNVELDKGTVDFWYQPNYNKNDGVSHRIFSIGPSGQPGSIGLYKRVAAYGNDLYVIITTGTGNNRETAVSGTSFNWNAGQWVNIRVTWDSTVAAGVQNTRFYIDGNELSYTFFSTGPFTMPAESPSNYIYIGSITATEQRTATGVLDEFMIYPVPMTPPAIPTPTPTNTSTPTSTSTFDTTPPQVSITSPLANSEVSNITTARASASDNVGVTSVQFKVDGVNAGLADTTYPYSIAIDMQSLSEGNHILSSEARDAAGNTATSSIPIIVNNTTRPNIVFIITDDQRFDTMQYMPLTSALLGNSSIKFTNAFVSTSLCCPSRATIFTGRYAHNTGIYFTSAPNGGAISFNDASTIATWLQDTGYRTALLGKYLNGYNLISPYIPPGWTEWHAFVRDSSPEPYYNYQINHNGTIQSYGSAPQDYSTDVLAGISTQLIQNNPSNQPLFLYIAPFAPHYPFTPAPSDIGSFSSFPDWRPLSYNEADVSDKPQWVQQLPLLDATASAQGDANHRMQLESLQAVDRMVESVINMLSSKGELNNTVIFFTSDNGLSWGEHRFLDDKVCVYEECSKVPLWVSAPSIAARTDNNLVENIDFAPTIADFAGVPVPSNVNGMSFTNLLSDPQTPWRNGLLLEGWGHYSALTNLHGYQGVRTSQYVYAEYYNGDRELYDLLLDSFQLNNVVNDPSYSTIILQLQNLLNNLRNQ